MRFRQLLFSFHLINIIVSADLDASCVWPGIAASTLLLEQAVRHFSLLDCMRLSKGTGLVLITVARASLQNENFVV